MEKWQTHLDNHEVVGALLTDLSKAFDCLPHHLLIAKLHSYGFDTKSTVLITDYLRNRKQRVKLNGICGSWMEILRGVPQGSVLGPVLFNVFICDLAYLISEDSLLNYADDNTLSAHASNTESLQSALLTETNKIMEWFRVNYMKANPSKFQILTVGKDKKKDFRISIDHTDIIESENFVKLVGVYIDNQLTFDKHIHEMCVKAGRQLNILKRLSTKLSEESKLCIFRSFILSHFNYCPIVWHFCSRYNIVKLERIQERGLRFVFNDYFSSYEALLSKAGLSTLEIGRIRNIAVEMYKAINGYSPPYICSLIETRNSNYNLREPLNVNLPRPNSTKFGKKVLNILVHICGTICHMILNKVKI